MAVHWRKIIVAGFAGFVCGRAIKYAKKHSEETKYILKCSACAGLLGVTGGAAYGLYRGRPAYVYSLSLGANMAAVAVVFLGVRRVVREALAGGATRSDSESWWTGALDGHSRDYAASGTSGGVTGLTTAAIARLVGLSGLSMYGAVTSVTSGAFVGCAGQYVWNRCQRWRKDKAILLHYPELLEEDAQDGRSWSWDNFTRRFVEITHRQMIYSVLQEEVTALEEAIAEERAAIESLNRSLNLETPDSDLNTMQSDRTEPTPSSNENPQTGNQTSS